MPSLLHHEHVLPPSTPRPPLCWGGSGQHEHPVSRTCQQALFVPFHQESALALKWTAGPEPVPLCPHASWDANVTLLLLFG